MSETTALVTVNAEGEIVSTPVVATSAVGATSTVGAKRGPGRPKGSKTGVSVRKVTPGRVKLAKETTLALTHKLLRGSADLVVAKVIAKALDDASPIQAACLKLCLDRIAPIAAFERVNAGQMNRVEVVVTLAADAAPVARSEVVDVTATEIPVPKREETDEEAEEGGEQLVSAPEAPATPEVTLGA